MDRLKYDESKKAPLIINLDVSETGERIECKCTTSRFMCKDFLEEPPFVSLNYHYNRSWPVLKELSEIVLFFKPYCVVEVGAGESTIVLAGVTQKAGVVFHSVDIRPEKTCKYHRNHFYHNMWSQDFMKTFDERPAIVLIDGDHRYETAKKEFDFFFDKLVPGGMMFIHDTMPPHEAFLKETACGDVYKLRQELEKRDDLDCLTFPYTAQFMGLTVVMKKENDLNYWEK